MNSEAKMYREGPGGGADLTKYVSADTTLEQNDRHVYAQVSVETDDIDITLAPVQEMAGCFVDVRLAVAGEDDSTATIIATDDEAFSPVILATDADQVLLYSTGQHWLLVYDGIAERN